MLGHQRQHGFQYFLVEAGGGGVVEIDFHRKNVWEIRLLVPDSQLAKIKYKYTTLLGAMKEESALPNAKRHRVNIAGAFCYLEEKRFRLFRKWPP